MYCIRVISDMYQTHVKFVFQTHPSRQQKFQNISTVSCLVSKIRLFNKFKPLMNKSDVIQDPLS